MTFKYERIEGVKNCPCCGGEIDTLKLYVSLEARIILFRGSVYPVAPQLASFLFTLAQKAPKAVPYFVLHDAVFGPSSGLGQETMRQRLGNYAHAARKLLRGVEVRNVSSEGYRLEFHRRDD